MISEAEFVRQVTEAGHAPQLRRMTLKELDSFCHNFSHDMFVRKASRHGYFLYHNQNIKWLDESEEWRYYDYYIVPYEEIPLNIEELI